MEKIVDAYAFLVWLQKERGFQVVKELLEDAEQGQIELYISMINAGEVYYRLAKAKSEQEAEDWLSSLPSIPVKIVSATDRRVKEAVRVKAHYPIAYADAFAAQAAIEKNAALVTGDPDFQSLAQDGWIKIEWLAQ